MCRWFHFPCSSTACSWMSSSFIVSTHHYPPVLGTGNTSCCHKPVNSCPESGHGRVLIRVRYTRLWPRTVPHHQLVRTRLRRRSQHRCRRRRSVNSKATNLAHLGSPYRISHFSLTGSHLAPRPLRHRARTIVLDFVPTCDSFTACFPDQRRSQDPVSTTESGAHSGGLSAIGSDRLLSFIINSHRNKA